MTKDEAISILTSLQEPEAWEPQISEKAFSALQMAIEALRKQMPKKPEDDRFVSNPFIWYTYCPQCRREINTGDKYCTQCGQAIDWTEGEQ